MLAAQVDDAVLAHTHRDGLHAAQGVADDDGDHERHCRPKGESDEDESGDSSHGAVIGIE